MSPRIIDYLTTARDLLEGSRVNYEINVADDRETDINPYIDTNSPIKILDLANGRLRPQYQLLLAKGYQVVGIDLVNSPHAALIDYAYQVARLVYKWHIPYQALHPSGSGLIGGDVTNLPFGNNTFDLVTSNAAFEHFLDVIAVVSELHRVLRSGGIAWIRVHVFTCLSGGHNLSFTEKPITKLPHGVEPWDHLRKRKIPFSVPLNEWRIGQYISAFSNYFEILKHYCAVREGQYLLTTEIKEELANYSPDELTCCTYAILARKND